MDDLQVVFNLAYWLLDSFFGLFPVIHAPSFLTEAITFIAKYAPIVNYYVPLNLLIVVTVACLAFQLVLMGVSAVLQIF